MFSYTVTGMQLGIGEEEILRRFLHELNFCLSLFFSMPLVSPFFVQALGGGFFLTIRFENQLSSGETVINYIHSKTEQVF